MQGSNPTNAITETTQEFFAETPFADWATNGLQSVSAGSREAIAGFGQSCNTRGAFPAVVHLIGKYEGDLKEALIENVMAGGDSASRGMVVGMVLGAHLGLDAISSEWLSGLKGYRHILQLLERIDGER